MPLVINAPTCINCGRQHGTKSNASPCGCGCGGSGTCASPTPTPPATPTPATPEGPLTLHRFLQGLASNPPGQRAATRPTAPADLPEDDLPTFNAVGGFIMPDLTGDYGETLDPLPTPGF